MKYTYHLFLLFTLTLYSCNKTIEVTVPMGKFTNSAVYETDDLAQAGMRGIYATMINAFATCPFEGVLSTSLGLSSDELVRGGSYSTDQQLLLENNLLPGTGIVGSLWNTFYNYILQANMIYENVDASPGLTPATKNRLMGEARFVRALSLFYLTNLYGNVPLTVTSDYPTNSLLPAAPQQEIYSQIIADLLYAKSKMGGDYVTAGSRHRPNKWAATALLARVYLYQKDWANAEAQSSEILTQSTIYRLDLLENVFNANSTEAIWALNNAGTNIYTGEGGTVTGTNLTNTQTRFTPYLLSQFSTDDRRLLKWTRTSINVTPANVAPYKYKTFSNDQAGAKTEASMVLRLGEQYLTRAEARAMLGNLNGAIDDVDALRLRAGAVADGTKNFQTIRFSNPSISQTDLITVIYRERMTELFSEFGHRWLDAKRAEPKDLATFFGTRKPGITQTDAYFPIPEKELLFNPNLRQNEGY